MALKGPLSNLGINIPKNTIRAIKRALGAVVAIFPQKKGKNEPDATNFRHNGKMAVTEVSTPFKLAIIATFAITIHKESP